MTKLIAVLERIERAMAFLGAVAIAAIMVIVAADVVMRYFFHSPIIGVAELVGLYLMVFLFYGVLSSTFARDAHIRVDLVLGYVSKQTRRIFEAISCALAAPIFLLIAIPSMGSAWKGYRNGDVLAGLIPWPTWIPPFIVALGAALIAVRLTVNCIAQLLPLFGGRETVPPPDITGHEESAI